MQRQRVIKNSTTCHLTILTSFADCENVIEIDDICLFLVCVLSSVNETWTYVVFLDFLACGMQQGSTTLQILLHISPQYDSSLA